MLILALPFLLLQIAFGYLISAFIDSENKLNRAEFFVTSVVVGLASSTFLLLGFLLLFQSWTVAINLIWLCLLISSALIIWKKIGFTRFKLDEQFHFRALLSPLTVGFIVFLSLYAVVLVTVFMLNEEGGYASAFNSWGDTALHLGIVGKLKASDPFVLDHPVLSGELLTYPFIVNLMSALYERIGFPKTMAWHIPEFSFGFSFFILLFLFGKRIFNENRFAFALVLLVFFGSGIGFVLFFQNLSAAWETGGWDAVFTAILKHPYNYTLLAFDSNAPSEIFRKIVWFVPAVSFFSHQRPFVLGASIATVLFLGFLLYRGSPRFWRWSILWGMLPLLHTHTFLAVSIALAILFLFDLKNWITWVKGAIIGAIIAIPQMLFLLPESPAGSQGLSFLTPWLGWMFCSHNSSWYRCDQSSEGGIFQLFWFWTINFGLIFWVWAAGTIWYFIIKRNEQDNISTIKPFLISGIVLFIIPNIVRFQPWDFDNNKILFYWWIFASVMTLLLFKNLLGNSRITTFALIIIVFLSTFSGLLDILNRVTHFSERFGYYGQREVELSKWIEENTNPDDSFLTGEEPTQYIPMLTGRSIYQGYGGWLWTHGKSHIVGIRKERGKALLTDGNQSPICKDGVDYILWDRELLKMYPDASYDRVLQSAEVVFTQDINSETREILKIKCP